MDDVELRNAEFLVSSTQKRQSTASSVGTVVRFLITVFGLSPAAVRWKSVRLFCVDHLGNDKLPAAFEIYHLQFSAEVEIISASGGRACVVAQFLFTSIRVGRSCGLDMRIFHGAGGLEFLFDAQINDVGREKLYIGRISTSLFVRCVGVGFVD